VPLTALALVLTAAVLHATWNLVAKRAQADDDFVALMAVASSVIWAPLALPLAFREVGGWPPVALLLVLLSGALHLTYFRTLLRGDREGDLTVVYPVARGTGPLLAATGAVLLLGEPVTLAAAGGILGIAGGVFLIAGGGGGGGAASDEVARLRRARGIRWGLATGAVIAAFTVLDG
jgi:drug/metabolite transporter (DMT)-like permease